MQDPTGQRSLSCGGVDATGNRVCHSLGEASSATAPPAPALTFRRLCVCSASEGGAAGAGGEVGLFSDEKSSF
jgi:hypothetical protein